MPLPMATPARLRSASVSSSPAPRQASPAATSANCAKRSSRSDCAASKCSPGSNSGTSAAAWTRYADGSNCAIRLMPLRPPTSPSQNACTPTPRADTAPRPVTATRRTSVGLGARCEQSAETVDDLSHAPHRRCDLVRHHDPEVVLESEEKIGGVERVDAEPLERRVERHGRRVQLLLTRDEVDDLAFDVVCHWGLPPALEMWSAPHQKALPRSARTQTEDTDKPAFLNRDLRYRGSPR